MEEQKTSIFRQENRIIVKILKNKKGHVLANIMTLKFNTLRQIKYFFKGTFF